MNELWTPRIVIFQCQYNLRAMADREWIETAMPPNFKLIQVPCTGRISPLFVLNAVQGGVDGILISGCVPEKCHFKKGNLSARRQLDELRRFLAFLGMEEQRMRFAWIDLAERGRIRREIADLEEVVLLLGRADRLVTRAPALSWGETA
jgi:F420-non-reducing hydrogenase iron-sulfur subunit